MVNSNFNKDTVILDRLSKGDATALNLLYETYWEQLFISAYNLLKNKEACEDILQELFISLWNKRERLQINISIKSYLYASVTYKVYDYLRKNSKVIQLELLEDFDNRIHFSDPESKMIHKELVNHINEVIQTLPEKCRKVFIMSREEQLSHKEIAEKLKISSKTVEAHITKALKAIKLSLGSFATIELVYYIVYNIT